MALRKSITLNIEPQLEHALSEAAIIAGVTLEQMAVDAIEQQLEIALRHRVLISRLEQMDEHIVALAEFVGEVGAQPSDTQTSSICRYHPGRGETV